MPPKPVVSIAEEVVALRSSLSSWISGCWEAGEHPSHQPINLLFLDRVLDVLERIAESLPAQTGV